MRKKLLPVIAITLIASFSLSSCIGSFSLTNKVLTWNKQVSNKFVNELVFFAFWILPVYEVTSVADLIVINSIEYWSGKTPIEEAHRIIDTDQGQYFIASDETGYKITSPNGDTLNFHFNSESQSWSFNKNDNEKIEFLQFIDDSHVKIATDNNQFVDVELTQQGVDNFKRDLSPVFMADL